MSAYLATDKSMSVIARSVEHFANLKPQFGTNPIWKALDTYHDHFFTQPSYRNTEEHMADKLFYKLVEVNMLSLRERYDDAETLWGKSAKVYSYNAFAPIVSIPVVIDLLDNWQYQACEGAAVETDFYKLTETVKAKLALEYVRKTRPYEDTVWEISDYAELDKVKGAYVR